MKTFLSLSFLLLNLSLFAQTLTFDGVATRAVVIGISEYQDEKINDLKYAHRDAEAFVGWLKSPAGGSLDDSKIQLLTNENATNGKMSSALAWLIQSSKKGDKAIIYFSGHGDAEKITSSESGFLLTYDSPPNVYAGTAYPVFFLQSVIKTLSGNGVDVIMISDACRSGKIAGSETGGAQQTTSAIALQFDKEVKILSCQPTEFSLESEKWGGGRGVFSFYLLKGLYGEADTNKDGQVTLLEIENFLETNVPGETAPKSQIPMTVGDKSTTVSIVDADALAAFQANNQNAIADNSTAVGSRGIQASILETTDNQNKKDFQQFEKAIESKHLLTPQGKSAYDIYLKAKIGGADSELIELMQRTLVAAFQDETQKVINDNLQTKYFYEERLVESINQVSLFSEYMAKGAEIVGQNDYQYNSLKSKEHYFRGLKYTLSSDLQFNDSLLNLALNENFKALEYEKNASYIYHDIGNNYFKKAQYFNQYGIQNDYHFQARDNFIKATELSPDWLLALSRLATTYLWLYENEKANQIWDKIKQMDPNNEWIFSDLGYNYMVLQRTKEAEEMFHKSLAIDPNYIYALSNLGYIYFHHYKDYQKAYEYYSKVLELNPNDYWAYLNLAQMYQEGGQFTEAEHFLLTGLEKQDYKLQYYQNLGYLYIQMQDFQKAFDAFNKILEIDPYNAIGYVNLSYYYYLTNDTESALNYMETGLAYGYLDHNWIKGSFINLAENPRFQQLMQTYFPNNN